MARKIGGVDPKRGKPRSKPKQKSPRTLMLKFRVRPLVRMPKSVMFAKLRSAIKIGVMPDDLEIAYMEWDHAQGRRFQPGERIDGATLDEMEKFYGVLLATDERGIRLERPDR